MRSKRDAVERVGRKREGVVEGRRRRMEKGMGGRENRRRVGVRVVVILSPL